MKNKITDFLELKEQFDVKLQGCDTDCKEYLRVNAAQVEWLETNLGINCTEASEGEIQEGMKLAAELGVEYCYCDLTPVTFIGW